MPAPKSAKKTKASSKSAASLALKNGEKPKIGRPHGYTDELGKQICDLIAQRVPAVDICAMDGMPSKDTLYRWKREIESFADLYARAREHRADARQDHIDEIVKRTIAGELDAQVARVAIDAEKWQMSKEQPRRYSDKLMQEVTGKDGAPLVPQADTRTLAKAVLSILQKAKVEDGAE